MATKGRKKEAGFAAAWGMIILALLSLLAGFAVILIGKQANFYSRSLLATELRLAAESAVVEIAAGLCQDSAQRAAVDAGSPAKDYGEISAGDITVKRYAKKISTGYMVYAVASSGRAKNWEKTPSGSVGTRVVGYVANASGSYYFARMEH